MNDRQEMDRADPASDQRIIEISQLAGGLAHEIRNPLSTLLLNLKLLDEDIAEQSDQPSDVMRRCRQRIGIVRQEAERLQRMLDEFLLIVGPVGLSRQRTDLNDIARRLAHFYQPECERHGIELRSDCADIPLWCRIDPDVFQQAVLNLLINAQQAMAGGGVLTLRTFAQDEFAVLTVQDTGEGMTEEVKQKAFRAFYSTKPNGSGLGLATTSRIVSAHGGIIESESEPGKGTCFRIKLPVADVGA